MITEIETRLFISLILGFIIGLDREIHRRPAGLRTHILVCMGATLFTITSITISNADPSRIAAGIVTGIGFLGAGSIFRYEDKVEGLTTAADLWIVSAIGLSVGLGMYRIAVITTLLVLLILVMGKYLDKRVHKKQKRCFLKL